MECVMDQRMPRKAVRATPAPEGHVQHARAKEKASALTTWVKAMRGWMLGGKERTADDWAKLRRSQHDLPADATTRARRSRLRMQKANRRANRGGRAVRHTVHR